MKNIKKAFKIARISDTALAAAIGCSRKTVCKHRKSAWHPNQRSNESPEKFVERARAVYRMHGVLRLPRPEPTPADAALAQKIAAARLRLVRAQARTAEMQNLLVLIHRAKTTGVTDEEMAVLKKFQAQSEHD